MRLVCESRRRRPRGIGHFSLANTCSLPPPAPGPPPLPPRQERPPRLLQESPLFRRSEWLGRRWIHGRRRPRAGSRHLMASVASWRHLAVLAGPSLASLGSPCLPPCLGPPPPCPACQPAGHHEDVPRPYVMKSCASRGAPALGRGGNALPPP